MRRYVGAAQDKVLQLLLSSSLHGLPSQKHIVMTHAWCLHACLGYYPVARWVKQPAW